MCELARVKLSGLYCISDPVHGPVIVREGKGNSFGNYQINRNVSINNACITVLAVIIFLSKSNKDITVVQEGLDYGLNGNR